MVYTMQERMNIVAKLSKEDSASAIWIDSVWASLGFRQLRKKKTLKYIHIDEIGSMMKVKKVTVAKYSKLANEATMWVGRNWVSALRKTTFQHQVHKHGAQSNVLDMLVALSRAYLECYQFNINASSVNEGRQLTTELPHVHYNLVKVVKYISN